MKKANLTVIAGFLVSMFITQAAPVEASETVAPAATPSPRRRLPKMIQSPKTIQSPVTTRTPGALVNNENIEDYPVGRTNRRAPKRKSG